MKKEYFLNSLFSELNEININYFVFGEYENLPKHTGNSDLDLIISQQDLNKTQLVLKKIIKNSNVKIVSYYTNNNGLFYRVFSDTEDFWGVQLDLFFKGFYFQNQEYFPVSEVKNNIIYHKEIKVLDIQKAYFVGFLKEIVHNFRSKDKYIKGFIKVISEDKEYYKELLINLYGLQFVKLVFTDLSINGIKSNSKELGEIIFKRIHKVHFSKIKNFISKLAYVKRLSKKPGYSIAFLGTDGSGKSTIIESISPLLNEAFHKSVFYEHMRPNKLPSIARLFGRKEDFDTPVTDPHSAKQSGFMGSLIRFGYYYIDYTIGYFLKVYPKIAFKSTVWIFDRYYYDYLLDQKRARIKLPQFIIKLGAFLMPKPDIIICLGTDAEKIYKRKPEISLDEVKRQVKALKMFASNNKRAVWIDTGVDIETSKKECLNYIINFMGSRFKHFE